MVIRILILLLVSSIAHAEPAKLQQVPVANMSDIMLTLFMVVGLIFACGWLVKKWMNGQTGMAGQKHLKIISALPFGTRERIALIQVGDQQLVVGITAQSINTLHVLDTPIAPEAATAPNAFQLKLASLMKGKEE